MSILRQSLGVPTTEICQGNPKSGLDLVSQNSVGRTEQRREESGITVSSHLTLVICFRYNLNPLK